MAGSVVTRNLVITGGSAGLGLEALRQLLVRPGSDTWKIIIGARSVSRIDDAVASLKNAASESSTLDSVQGLSVDLGDLDAVRRFAEKVVAKVEDQGIDVLVLNAGIWNPKKRMGKEWVEEMEVNHLNQHHLIQLLLPQLQKAASTRSARIVVVSSQLHLRAPSTNEEVLSVLKGTTPSFGSRETYSTAKWAQMVGCQYWRSKLLDSRPPIDVVAISPGFVPTTDLFRGAPWPVRYLGSVVLPWMPFATTLEEGGGRIVQGIAMPSQELRAEDSTGYLVRRKWGPPEPRTKEEEWWKQLCPLLEDESDERT